MWIKSTSLEVYREFQVSAWRRYLKHTLMSLVMLGPGFVGFCFASDSGLPLWKFLFVLLRMVYMKSQKSKQSRVTNLKFLDKKMGEFHKGPTRGGKQ